MTLVEAGRLQGARSLTKVCHVCPWSWSLPDIKLVLQSPLARALLTHHHRQRPLPPSLAEALTADNMPEAECQEKAPHRPELSEKGTIYWSHGLTRGDVGRVSPFPCPDAHFWICFPTSILLRKKPHEKRHHQAILVTEEAGPQATGVERERLHCSESREPVLGSQGGELGFQEPQLTLLLARDKRRRGGGAWLNPWPSGGFPARGGHGGPAEAGFPHWRGGADSPSPSH